MPRFHESNSEAIAEYTLYFLQEIELVRSYRSRLHQKVLYTAILDSLAVAYVDDKDVRPRDRVVRFLRECIRWPHCNKVSSIEFLKRSDGETPLAAFLEEHVKKSSLGGLLWGPDEEFAIEELVGRAETEEEKTLLDRARFDNMFYHYRNALVHEFIQRGSGAQFQDSDEPYYMGTPEGHELVLHQNVFAKLCEKGVVSLNEHLTKADRDPYASYLERGAPWSE